MGTFLLAGEASRRGRSSSLLRFAPVNPKTCLECWIWAVRLTASISWQKLELTNSKSLGRVFYREFSNRRLAGTSLTESGQEYVAYIVEVPNRATILLTYLIPAVVVREQKATGMSLRHRTHQLEMQFERLSADGVKRNPRAELRHCPIDG
jgi:hypothetical protein